MNQLLVKILSYLMPAKESHDPIAYMTTKFYARKKLLILGLMADSTDYAIFPNIYLRGEKILKINLRNPESRMSS